MPKTATARHFRMTITHPDGTVNAAISPARHVNAVLARARKGNDHITPTATGGVVITRKVYGARLTVALEPIPD